MFKFPDMLLFPLAGAAMLSAVIMTILNGLAYTTLPTRSLAPAAGLAPVALSAISCVALIMLTFLVHKDVGRGGKLAGWKAAVFYFTVVYLLVAAGSTAGTMATSPDRTSLSITRSVFWAMSIFAQGSYCGYLLVRCSQTSTQDPQWPRSYPQELKTLPETPSSIAPPAAVCDPYPEHRFDTRRGSLRKFPRRSSRYSGGTLDLDSSKPEYPTETNSMISSLSVSPTNDHKPVPFLDPEQDTRPLLRGTGSIRSMPSLRQDGVRPSLDNLMQPASPVTSIFHTGVSNESVETLAPREHNIHPLFRSTSPSPSPTPTPGTVVKASPSAGHTITHQTLTRMRSARSLREQGRQTPSPLPVPPDVSHHEKRYDLNESPYEK
ncbi:hypothetical protein N7468_004984 [Penicillium chermesinum]|uniref:Uncharacterized protein n=1 Tax=Penicillium chermesinum TaxID=63820 RepID=A0A9W9TMW6_9EURO|nr:uncharacterized protein N7468_004984 [Penicillium chermesinum]KAJ5232028.1 hypothetical protein N7468_004984 [Penicillium chermesinum]